MNVSFSTFSKKLNSTARSSGGTTYNCRLKKGSSKLQPFIELAASDPTAFNYAYIPNYGRYYYVDNWTFDGGLWAADLTVDVLASFKDAIGGASLYILRSSAEYDEKVLDTMYPAKEGGTATHATLTKPFTTDYASGSYVVGVISPSAASGAVAYYVLSYSQMASLRAFMMGTGAAALPSWTDDWNTEFPQLTGEAIRAMINPFQYVASCMWLPFSMYAGGGAAMDFGYWQSGLSFPTMSASVWFNQQQVAVPQNFVGAADEWRRQAPFASYQISYPPFGTFDLDPSFMAQEAQLDVVVSVDPVTGGGKLRIDGASTRHVYVDVAAQVGVPVQLAQMSTDAIGAAGTYANSVASIAGNALSGNIVGAVASAISGIGDTARATLPTVSTAGSNGGVGALRGPAEFQCYFRDVVDYAPDLLGRPLCKTRTPAALSGYMVAQSGSCVSSGATREEKEQIRAYLEGGFYYE